MIAWLRLLAFLAALGVVYFPHFLALILPFLVGGIYDWDSSWTILGSVIWYAPAGYGLYKWRELDKLRDDVFNLIR